MAAPQGTITPTEKLVAVPPNGMDFFTLPDDEADSGITVTGGQGVATIATGASVATPDVAVKHPEWLVKQVEELELPANLLDVLDTAHLQQVVVEAMRRERKNALDFAAAIRELKPGARDAGHSPGANPPQPGVIPAEASTEAFDWGEYEEADDLGRVAKRKYTDDDVSPVFRDHIKRLTKELKDIKSEFAEFKKASDESVKRSAASRVDAELNAVFDSMPAVFGQGDPKKLDKKLYLRRATVAKAAAELVRSSEGKLPIREAAANMAKALFDAEPEAEEEVLAVQPQPAPRNGHARPTPEQFRNGRVAAPTQRNTSPEPYGDKRAAKALADRLKSLHASDDGDDETDDTDLSQFLK